MIENNDDHITCFVIWLRMMFLSSMYVMTKYIYGSMIYATCEILVFQWKDWVDSIVQINMSSLATCVISKAL